MRPPSGARSPSTHSIVVVLPAPFGPIRPKISPRRTVKETSSAATVGPYALRRASTSMTWSGFMRLAGRPQRCASRRVGPDPHGPPGPRETTAWQAQPVVPPPSGGPPAPRSTSASSRVHGRLSCVRSCGKARPDATGSLRPDGQWKTLAVLGCCAGRRFYCGPSCIAGHCLRRRRRCSRSACGTGLPESFVRPVRLADDDSAGPGGGLLHARQSGTFVSVHWGDLTIRFPAWVSPR